MRTVGISLAAPAATVACAIDWGSNSNQAEIVSWFEDLDDDNLTEFMCDPSVLKVGIDAPFGWPIDIVDPVDSYQAGGFDHSDDSVMERSPIVTSGIDARGQRTGGYEYIRATDWNLWCQFGEIDQSMWFLTRSWRKCFYRTRRSEELLIRLSHESGTEIDRTGEGRCVEVCPGAALIRWGIEYRGVLHDYYRSGINKSQMDFQRIVINGLKERLESMLFGLEASVDHCIGMYHGGPRIDALVSALVARSLAVGNCEPIPSDSQPLAEVEGWVRLPKGPDLGTDLMPSS